MKRVLKSRTARISVLERVLERVDKVKVTAHAVFGAVRAYTRTNDRGGWMDRPARIIVSSGSPPVTRSRLACRLRPGTPKAPFLPAAKPGRAQF